MSASIVDKDRGWKDMRKAFAKGKKNASVRVGVQGDGKVRSAGAIDIVAQATVHEFGSLDGHIPQRSFIRSTFDAKKEYYQRLINKLAEQIFDGKQDSATALGLLGQKFVADIKNAIRAGIAPPLAQSTLAHRHKKIEALAGNKNQSKATAAVAGGFPDGSVTPLIDTGRMINSIRAVVDNQ